MAIHSAITANVLELQAIKLVLFGIAARVGVHPSWVRDVCRRLDSELIREIKQVKKEMTKNGDTNSGEGEL